MAFSLMFWKKGVVAADEAWVIGKLHSLENGAKIAEADAAIAFHWILANYATIAQNVQGLINIAAVTGASANPIVATAIGAANATLTAISAYQARVKAGHSTLNAVAQAYQALKDTQIAHAQGAQAVIATKTSPAEAPQAPIVPLSAVTPSV